MRQGNGIGKWNEAPARLLVLVAAFLTSWAGGLGEAGSFAGGSAPARTALVSIDAQPGLAADERRLPFEAAPDPDRHDGAGAAAVRPATSFEHFPAASAGAVNRRLVPLHAASGFRSRAPPLA